MRRPHWVIPSFFFARERHGKGERELTASAKLRLCQEVATHSPREIAADGETQSHACVGATRRIDLHKGFEDQRQFFPEDALPGVGDADADSVCTVIDREGDVTARRAVLDRVRLLPQTAFLSA